MTNKTTKPLVQHARKVLVLLAAFIFPGCVQIAINVPASERVTEIRTEIQNERTETLQNPKAEKPIILEKVDPCDACVEQMKHYEHAPLNEEYHK